MKWGAVLSAPQFFCPFLQGVSRCESWDGHSSCPESSYTFDNYDKYGSLRGIAGLYAGWLVIAVTDVTPGGGGIPYSGYTGASLQHPGIDNLSIPVFLHPQKYQNCKFLTLSIPKIPKITTCDKNWAPSLLTRVKKSEHPPYIKYKKWLNI